MEDKRLDFDAPLLSARRLSAPAAEERGSPARRRASLPFYKPELKSGPVGKPGIVPFVWEQSPGRPKDGPPPASVRTRRADRPPAAPKPPPGRILTDRDSESSPSARIPLPKNPSFDLPKENDVAVEKKGDCFGDLNTIADVDDGGEDEEEEEDFTDALDTLSRTESFFMNCSVSGLTGGSELTAHTGSFATDPQVRDFMMGRFLPAAQAMASSSPQCAPRKQSAPSREPARLADRFDSGAHRRPLPLPYQHMPNYVAQDAREPNQEESDGEDDAEEYNHSGRLGSKACGLLPQLCLKSAFCLLNPVPGMKVRGGPPPLPRRTNNTLKKAFHHSSLGQIEDEHSWEAVYKHKLGRGDPPLLEDGSKLTSESNQLTYWSDSPTADGSSPHRRSAGGISPYRNEAPQSPFHEGKGFLGVPKSRRRNSKGDSSDSCEKDRENYWEVTTNSGSLKGSGSMSPAIERTLYVDSRLNSETHAKSSSAGTVMDIGGVINAFGKNSEVEEAKKGVEETLLIETHGGDCEQLKHVETVEPSLPLCAERSDHGQMGGSNDFKQDGNHNGPLSSKTDDQGSNDANPLQSLLAPPLPKSPSESWLWRTLPSVSSKSTAPQSFLGIQVQSRRQALRASFTDPKPDANVQPLKPHRQIRFADELAKPVSPISEA